MTGNGHEEEYDTQPLRVLVADDVSEMRDLITRAFLREGYEVTECVHGLDLLGHLSTYFVLGESERVDLVVTDIRMPGLTGLEILEGLMTREGAPPMILITAFGDEKTHTLAEKFGAAAVLDKPFDIADLVRRANRVLRDARRAPAGPGDVRGSTEEDSSGRMKEGTEP